jgi:hypothetical protein
VKPIRIYQTVSLGSSLNRGSGSPLSLRFY